MLGLFVFLFPIIFHVVVFQVFVFEAPTRDKSRRLGLNIILVFFVSHEYVPQSLIVSSALQPFFLRRVLVFFGFLLLECVMDGRVDVATSADLASTFRE